ncbi:MAG: T9SS type A sorting domain-containing protein [Bacteroidetes bacterium]|nr:T9SS type A sorting domain-containing protein [Bacteroidota bacterium]
MSYGPAPTTSGIIGNLTGGAVCLTGNVTVNSNWTLIDEDLIISSGVTITVLNGFTMTIQNNSEFYAASTTWGGIVVEAGGHLIMNNSQIKDAEIAIKAINSGGIESEIDITESCLLNNEIGIYYTGSLSTPSNSTIIDNDISGPSLPVSGLIGDYGILIDGVYVDDTSPYAIIIGNTLAYPGGGTNNDIHDYAIGIRAYNSNVTVQNNLVRDIHSTGFDLSNSPIPGGEAYLGGRIGILSTSTINPPRQVRLQVGTSLTSLNNEIVDVRDGIIADLNVNTSIIKNLLRSNSTANPDMRNGIQILNKSTNHNVQNNIIQNFRRQGIYCFNINTGILTIVGNAITNSTQSNGEGIDVEDATFLTSHTVIISSNTIGEVERGIITKNVNDPQILANQVFFRKLGTSSPSSVVYGIYAQMCPGADILSNYIEGDCNDPFICGNKRLAIDIFECPNFLIDKNYMYYSTTGCMIENDNMNGNLTCNEIHDCPMVGYGLKNVLVVGTDNYLGPIQQAGGNPSDNSWHPASTANRERHFGGTDVELLIWIYRDIDPVTSTYLAAYDMPDVLIDPDPALFGSLDPFLLNNTFPLCESPFRISEDSLALALAELESNFGWWTETTEIGYSLAYYYTQWFFYGDVIRIDGLFELLSPELLAKYESILATNIPTYYQMADSISTGAFLSSSLILSDILPSNVAEEYVSNVYQIYLENIDSNGRFILTDDSRAALLETAILPVEEYGFAVHIAQALLDTIIERDYSFELEEEDLKMAKKENITIYPNPSNGLLYFHSQDEFSGEVKIYSIQGKQIYINENINQNSRLDLSNFQSGLYIMKLTTKEGVTSTFTLILTTGL